MQLFELFTITLEADGPVLRLRHFDPRLVGWEEKDRPLTLKLVERGEGRVAFEGTGTRGVLRLSYRREGPDGLSSTLQRGDQRDEFRYKRFRAVP